MTRPEYGKPETWPRIPEAKLHIFHTGPGLIRRLGFLPCRVARQLEEATTGW